MFEFFNLLIIIQTLVVLVVGMLFQVEVEFLRSKNQAVDAQDVESFCALFSDEEIENARREQEKGTV